MFDWFFEFLYLISKSLFRIIDAMLIGARKLCGIDPITVDAKETDFLTFLFDSHEIKWSFMIACLLALVVLCIFSIIAIIRTTMKDKDEHTPTQIVIQSVKSCLLFLCVPAIMYISMWFGNALVDALNVALNGSSTTSSLGSYLFIAFAQDMELSDAEIAEVAACRSKERSYVDTDFVWTLGNGKLKSFDFILSWICGIAILFPVANTLIMFAERAISIVILYIVSPFSIATTVLDDGAHFKLWRDQVLVKFITGYGALLGLNVYGLVISVIFSRNVVFFPETAVGIPIFSNHFLNIVMELVIIVGGAFSMQKIQAVIGNLVQAGAGTSEMQSASDAGKRASGYLMSAADQTIGRAVRLGVKGVKLAYKGIKAAVGAATGGAGAAAGAGAGGGAGGGGGMLGGANTNTKSPQSNGDKKGGVLSALQNLSGDSGSVGGGGGGGDDKDKDNKNDKKPMVKVLRESGKKENNK